MAMTNYLRNKIVDWYHRQVSFTPPTSHWIALVTSTPNAGTAGTEVSGTGYARQQITLSTTSMASTGGDTTTTNPSAGTTGKTSNNAAVNFGTAGSAWGTVVAWEAYDASTGGNRLHFGNLVDSGGAAAPRSIATSDPVNFPISALQSVWQ